jgi:iron complex transport system substrate-binding protein
LPHLTRRSLLGCLAASATVSLAACSDDPVSTGTDDTGVEPSAGPWTFTDGLGQEISLDERPTRIAAYGDQAAALIGFGITPVAVFHYMDPSEDPTFEGVDLGDVPVIGTAYGEIEVERLIGEIQPDLVVTTSYPGETTDTMFGFKDKTQIAKIRKSAPILGIMQEGTAADVIAANEELVTSLGVDVAAVAEAKADWEAASEELREAAAKGLTVVPVFADDTGLWYAKAPDDPALAYYASLGVQFVDVGGDEYYWRTVSWENADEIATDLVLYSMRTSYTPEQLLDEPVFASLPAAEGGQLHPWKFKAMDYASQAAYMRELAGWLSGDAKLT